MDETVKRQYRSPARTAAAEETRARIREEALALFVAQGYQATTLKDVAERAGVGERTLYDSFGNKLGLLRHTVAMLTMGDESRVPAADRPAAVAAREADDPREGLAAHLRLGTDLMNRAGDLLLVTQAIPGLDPDLDRSISRGTQAAYDISRRVRTGVMGQNGMRMEFGMPFGGFKQSGIGREGGEEGLWPYVETKTILLDAAPATF